MRSEKKRCSDERVKKFKRRLWNKPVADTIPHNENNLKSNICPEWKKLGGWMILEKQVRGGGTAQKSFPLGCGKNYCAVCGPGNQDKWRSRIIQALPEFRQRYKAKHGRNPRFRMYTLTQRTRTQEKGSLGQEFPIEWPRWARMNRVEIEDVPMPDELDWTKPGTKIARQFKKMDLTYQERVVWRARCTPKQKQRLFSGFWKILMERWEYQWGERLEYVASREWTEQAEIHIHAMVVAPRKVKEHILRDWLAREWMDITGDAGPGRYERGVHTGYEKGDGTNAAWYISKYISKCWGKSWGANFNQLWQIGIYDEAEWDWDRGIRKIFRSGGIEIPDIVDEQFNLYEADDGQIHEFEPQLYRKAYGKYYYWMNKIMADPEKYSMNLPEWWPVSRFTVIGEVFHHILAYMTWWKLKMRRKIATALYINFEGYGDKKNGEITKYGWEQTGIEWYEEPAWHFNTQFKFILQPMRDRI